MAPDFDPDDLEGIDLVVDSDTRKTYAPSHRQKIHSFTVACLILNRTIGSGIFVTPAKILRATDSVGTSIIIWAVGGFISLCALIVWLEFGLSTPQRKVAGGEMQCVPRSGGEKNYASCVAQTAVYHC
jgi:amino acid transporter